MNPVPQDAPVNPETVTVLPTAKVLVAVNVTVFTEAVPVPVGVQVASVKEAVKVVGVEPVTVSVPFGAVVQLPAV